MKYDITIVIKLSLTHMFAITTLHTEYDDDDDDDYPATWPSQTPLQYRQRIRQEEGHLSLGQAPHLDFDACF